MTVKVVIAHRMGQGKNVAKGVENVGGIAILIPGMAADMKAGMFAKEHKPDFVISFCGSGGAGALSAQNEAGYKAKYGMRSIEEGITAIHEGYNALGFGFMDTEELGRRLTEEFIKFKSV